MKKLIPPSILLFVLLIYGPPAYAALTAEATLSHNSFESQLLAD